MVDLRSTRPAGSLAVAPPDAPGMSLVRTQAARSLALAVARVHVAGARWVSLSSAANVKWVP
jgi:hypothetical protein